MMTPYGKQEITSDDIESVVKVLKSDFLTQGPAVPQFEKALCDYAGSSYAVAVNSCTSALHIACLALGLTSKDIVWTSPITFVASANCARYCGASVDFVDVDPETALMSVDKLREKLIEASKNNRLPKIVIPVHFAGQPCDMKEIYVLSKEYGFKIIEDAAHAIGAKYQGKLIGCCQYSDITVFSFHPVKIITTGEGGCALTNDKSLADRMTLYRSHGITRDPEQMTKISKEKWYYEQTCLGFNYRLTDIQAALGSSQLARINDIVRKRTKIADWYDKNINLGLLSPLTRKENRESSHHLYVLIIKKGGVDRDKVYRHLIDSGIGVNLHYIPVYRQPYFNMKIRLPGAEQYYKSAISLPIFPAIGEKKLSKIVREIENICK